MKNITQVEIIKYLTILELPTNQIINNDIVKRQYRKLCKIYHPDVSKEDSFKNGDKFKILNEANEYISSNIEYVNIIIQNLYSGNIFTNNTYQQTYYEQKKNQEQERQEQERQEQKRQEQEREKQEKEKANSLKNEYISKLNKYLSTDFLKNYSEANKEILIDIVKNSIAKIEESNLISIIKDVFNDILIRLNKVKTLEQEEQFIKKKIKVIKAFSIFIVTSLFFLLTIYITNEFLLKATITFESNGGSIIEEIRDYKNKPLGELPTPIKEGYIFDGWYSDMSYTKKITELKVDKFNSTIYAKWIPIYKLKKIINSFNQYILEPYQEGTIINSLEDLNYEGYYFDGWFLDSSFQEQLQYPINIINDINIYGKLTKKCKVEFYDYFGNIIDTKEVRTGTKVDSIQYSAIGYNFNGWYNINDLKVAFPYTINDNISFYSKWDYFGIGTKEQPYEVYNEHQLMNIENSNKYYIVKQDFSISKSFSTINTFSGVLDFNNKTINNINNSYENSIIMTNYGELKNLNYTGIIKSNNLNSANYNNSWPENIDNIFGILVVNNLGLIENCNLVNMNIEFNVHNTIIGLIAGGGNGTINNCTISGTVKSMGTQTVIAGIIGYGGRVSNCTNNSDITNTSSYVAGISIQSFDINNCINYGNMVGIRYAGGISIITDTYNLKNCTNYGNITSSGGRATYRYGDDHNNYSSGILVLYQGEFPVNCKNYGIIKGAKIGGIVAEYMD